RTLAALHSSGWFPDGFQHCIMHQTARVAVEEVVRVLNRKSGESVLHHRNTINNLRHRGNTASTTHFVAMMDHVQHGRIQSGDRVVFETAAAEITPEPALYPLDDPPARLRGPPAAPKTNGRSASRNGHHTASRGRPVRIESVGLLPAGS